MAKKLIGCFLALAFLEVAASGQETSATDPAGPEKCAVLFEGVSGKIEHQILPSLGLQSLALSDTFVLPSDAPANVKAVQCGRLSLVPKDNDYKVLAAGFPLSIVADDRVGVLEVEEGRIRFNMLEGEMTEAEIERIQAVLNSSQEHINKTASERPAPEN